MSTSSFTEVYVSFYYKSLDPIKSKTALIFTDRDLLFCKYCKLRSDDPSLRLIHGLLWVILCIHSVFFFFNSAFYRFGFRLLWIAFWICRYLSQWVNRVLPLADRFSKCQFTSGSDSIKSGTRSIPVVRFLSSWLKEHAQEVWD